MQCVTVNFRSIHHFILHLQTQASLLEREKLFSISGGAILLHDGLIVARTNRQFLVHSRLSRIKHPTARHYDGTQSQQFSTSLVQSISSLDIDAREFFDKSQHLVALAIEVLQVFLADQIVFDKQPQRLQNKRISKTM